MDGQRIRGGGDYADHSKFSASGMPKNALTPILEQDNPDDVAKIAFFVNQFCPPLVPKSKMEVGFLSPSRPREPSGSVTFIDPKDTDVFMFRSLRSVNSFRIVPRSGTCRVPARA